jgi:hypothetical protein
VISAKVSGNGVDWGPDLPLITPDPVLDPPELQFYRMRPFYIGNTSRLAAHTLQYAPAPSQKILGKGYGRQPSMCLNKSLDLCHGPHLHGTCYSNKLLSFAFSASIEEASATIINFLKSI